MATIDEHLRIVDLLAQHELALADLYGVYADKMIEYEQLWYGLVSDEKKHASWIRAVMPKVKEGLVIINETIFPPETIEEDIKHIRNLIIRAQELDISLEEALNSAMKLEKGMIDRHFYKAFEGDPDALADMPRNLQTETQYHYQLVYETWREVRERNT